MRIDSHQHFWKYHPIKNSWIEDHMKVIRRDFLPDDLHPILEKNTIDGCIAVQADQSEEETEFLLSLAENNSFIKGVVGWVDLKSENIKERLSHFAKFNKLKGIRHIVQAEPDDYMLDEKFQRGISFLDQFNLTYDILVFPSQLSAAIELVDNFPHQKFVVDHIAKPLIKEGKLEPWKTEMISLAKSPNVMCKISGMVTEADWSSWESGDIKPYLDVIFNALGPDRIMFGSDWPVCLLAASYEQQLEIVETYISSFSPEDKNKIMGGNALNFYNLKEF